MCNAIVQLQQEVTNIRNLMSKHCQLSLHAAWFLLMHALWYVITCWFEVHRHSERIYEKDVVSCVLSAVDWLAGPALFVKVMRWRWGDTQGARSTTSGDPRGAQPHLQLISCQAQRKHVLMRMRGWAALPSPTNVTLWRNVGARAKSKNKHSTTILKHILKTRLLTDLAAVREHARSVLKSSELL